MSQAVFPEALRNFFPATSAGQAALYGMAGSGKAPLFLIDNILSSKASDKDCPRSLSSTASFSPPAAAMVDLQQFFGIPQRLLDGGHHEGSRMLSTFPPAHFYPSNCIPFPFFNPAALHPADVRSFLQNAPAFHNAQYGFKSNSHLSMNAMHPYFHGQTSRPLHKRKGGQVRFSNDQTLDLEQKFKKQKYLNPAERKKLAKSLTLSERQIKTWFQNRRAKWRRSKDGEQTDPSVEREPNPAGGEKPASCASSSVSVVSGDGPSITAKAPNKLQTNTGRVICNTTARPTSSAGFSNDEDDRHRQEMCNSDSESVCSDDFDEDVVDV